MPREKKLDSYRILINGEVKFQSLDGEFAKDLFFKTKDNTEEENIKMLSEDFMMKVRAINGVRLEQAHLLHGEITYHYVDGWVRL